MKISFRIANPAWLLYYIAGFAFIVGATMASGIEGTAFATAGVFTLAAAFTAIGRIDPL